MYDVALDLTQEKRNLAFGVTDERVEEIINFMNEEIELAMKTEKPTRSKGLELYQKVIGEVKSFNELCLFSICFNEFVSEVQYRSQKQDMVSLFHELLDEFSKQ